MENHKVRCLAGKEADTKTVVSCGWKEDGSNGAAAEAEVLGLASPRLSVATFEACICKWLKYFIWESLRKELKKCFLILMQF